MNNEKQHSLKASEFAQRWDGRGYEKGESQKFWLELLGDVLGVDHPTSFIEFEDQVQLDSTSFIDGYIPSTRVMIEQKSLGKHSRKPIRQSDGSMLTPFQQAKRYVSGLPLSRHPRWVVVCNFAEFLVYDMERPNGEPEAIMLADLGKEWNRLRFLTDTRSEHLKREIEVSMQAGDIIGEIYDALLERYGRNDNETLRQLNILCVRLVFCLYAEDSGIFAHDQFHDYLARHDADMMRSALLQLFEVLNTPYEQRSPYLREELDAFPYTNGGLFAEPIDIPQFSPELAQLILQNASLDFDWSVISPTIFGSVFESTLNPVTRRTGGMHYTSIENIHKVIDPLFLDDLRAEFNTIVNDKRIKSQRKRLLDFQNKLASLTFLDPACGSGNFLTETYLSLRRLENDVVRHLTGGRSVIGFEDFTPIKVSIDQFYGIEINDFAVTVATTALWISEAQMLAETESIIHQDIDFLPLKTYANIREGNALRMEWDMIDVPDETVTIHADTTYLSLERQNKVNEPVVNYGKINLTTSSVLPGPQPVIAPIRVHYDYIIGNPPFVGHQWRSKEQVDDMNVVFSDLKKHGKLDYVSCWYKKAADIMQGSNTKTAFVSTNSIVQGEVVATLWKYLFEKKHAVIDFAHQSFVWTSESKQKAAVHCVVIGFSCGSNQSQKQLFSGNGCKFVDHINGYLIAAPNVFIQSRGKPLLKTMPIMSKGSQPTDGGNLILSQQERNALITAYPDCNRFIKRYIGADEFINSKYRYCLWLKGVSPSEYRKIPSIVNRLKKVAERRQKSPTRSVRDCALSPMLFTQIRQPDTTYLVVPEVSSVRRRYIPIGFVEPDIISSNMLYIIPNASIYMFGILSSSIHMAWMRVICGRLKSDYRYTPAVYNNFPWPEVTDEQRGKISETAQTILDVRATYRGSSLADLYDEVTMPVELRKAHQANDHAVMEAYGLNQHATTEQQCVAELFKRYQQITSNIENYSHKLYQYV